jgi:diguanylate cyclase (GGDEF)-like protein/PAS domain S-box-containing protein
METSAQIILPGGAASSGWLHCAAFGFPLAAGSPIALHGPFLAFLLCLSAAAGVFLYRLYVRSAWRRPLPPSLMKELTMLRTVVANLPDMIYAKDAQSRFLMANQAAAKNVDAANSADLLGKTDFDFFPRALAEGFFEDERKVIASGQPQVSKEEFIEEADGHMRCILTTKVPLFDPDGKPIGIVGVGRNITAMKAVEAELKRARDELAFKAAHDSLTSLLNRGAILEMLSRELARSVRENGRTTVLLGDLDLFKQINDIHGHPIGDEVLQEVASRLIKTVRPYDLVGRFGGEEFLVVMPGCSSPDALTRADQLRLAIAAAPFKTTHGYLPLTISMGVLVVQEWGQPTAEEVLREVDAALYASKAAGRNHCCIARPPRGVLASFPDSN